MAENHSSDKLPLIIIAGPTASGKSAAAVELALRMNGSVISADSMQVYRGMDIGSAKVTEEEMRGVPHYLIDCVDPSESWNVVRFQQKAREAVREIAGSGRLPILCGGTGFYIQALLYDIDFTAMDENTPLREQYASLAAEKGPEALHAVLAARDPASAAAIHPNNVKRIIRALEFLEESGGSIAEHNLEQRERQASFKSVFFVLTMDRKKLYERIDRRVDIMLERGLPEEAREVLSSPLSQTAVMAIGYKELSPYIRGEEPLEACVEKLKRETRRYAKRQLTWFRRDKDIHWLYADEYDSFEELFAAAVQTIDKGLVYG